MGSEEDLSTLKSVFPELDVESLAAALEASSSVEHAVELILGGVPPTTTTSTATTNAPTTTTLEWSGDPKRRLPDDFLRVPGRFSTLDDEAYAQMMASGEIDEDGDLVRETSDQPGRVDRSNDDDFTAFRKSVSDKWTSFSNTTKEKFNQLRVSVKTGTNVGAAAQYRAFSNSDATIDSEEEGGDDEIIEMSDMRM